MSSPGLISITNLLTKHPLSKPWNKDTREKVGSLFVPGLVGFANTKVSLGT